MAKRRPLLGPITIHVALATVAVALGAVSVLALLTLLGARGDVSQLARQEQNQAASAVASAVRDAYQTAGSWSDAHLRAPAALAANSQATLTIIDAGGDSVAIPPVVGASPPRVLLGPVRRSAVVVNGRKVGTTYVHFYRASLPTAETNLGDALVRTVLAGAGLGALLALAVAIVLSRWITRPVIALTEAVRAMDAGDRSARVGRPKGGGELAELSTAFDKMADTIAHEEELRRAVVSDVAHELRTPLAILQASTESLSEGTMEVTPESLSSLHEEVLRLHGMVEDLETLASAEAATLRMDRQVVDLSEVGAQIVAALRPAYRSRGVELVADLTSAEALVDPTRVAQILGNLASNALKFTDPKGTVTVSVRSDAQGAVLEVSDTGRGIPADELPHVFERFWRGKQVGRVAGSGIGLAVVDTLVEAHGGSVEVTSSPSGGTCFKVHLPRPPGQASRGAPGPADLHGVSTSAPSSLHEGDVQ